MEKLKILVLGNSPHINQIDFTRLPSNVITLGTNRIWLKHAPNYFFFNDYEIIKELNLHPEKLAQLRQNSNIFSSDWLRRTKGHSIPNWIKIYDRPNKRRYPDSVTTAIELLKLNFFKADQVTFYIAGVSLRWSEPSHFWKELEYAGLNSNDEKWYAPRFEKMLENFKYLRDLQYNIISVTPESNLNKLFRYENIDNLYSKKF